MSYFRSSSIMVALLKSGGLLAEDESAEMRMLPAEYVGKLYAENLTAMMDVPRLLLAFKVNFKALGNGVAFEDTALPAFFCEAQSVGLTVADLAPFDIAGTKKFDYFTEDDNRPASNSSRRAWFHTNKIDMASILAKKQTNLTEEEHVKTVRLLFHVYMQLIERAEATAPQHADDWVKYMTPFFNFMRNTDSMKTMIKVYFACSIMGGGDTSQYLGIIQSLKALGANVISEVFAHDAINLGGSPLPADEIYQRDIDMINAADLVVAELSNPSLGVGYELGYAQAHGKLVLGLYNTDAPKKLSAMITGNPYFTIVNYVSGEVPHEEIREFIRSNRCV